MNKWRLLLLSVLSLLQSASAERSFVDGRGRYRSDTKLSIEDPYRIHKPFNEDRQLNAPKEFEYRARDVELITAPALRHFKHRELILTDRRRTVEAQRYRVHAQSDRRAFNQRNNNRDESARVDDRRNRIINRNQNIDQLETSRALLRGHKTANRVIRDNTAEARLYDDIPLNTIETNSLKRRAYNRRTDIEHGVSERRARLLDVRNDRAMTGTRFVKRELLRDTIYEEPERRRREVRAFEKTNTIEKQHRIHNENSRNMGISRSNVLRQYVPSYDATDMKARSELQRNIMVRDNNARNNVREKRIDSRLVPTVNLYRENYERRNVRAESNNENDRQCSRISHKLSIENRVIEVCHSRNVRNNRLTNMRHNPTYLQLTLTQEQQFQIPSNRVNEMQRTAVIREERLQVIRRDSQLSRNRYHSLQNLSKIQRSRENSNEIASRSFSIIEKMPNELRQTRYTREERATTENQRIRNVRCTRDERLLNTRKASTEEKRNERPTIHIDERSIEHQGTNKNIIREKRATREIRNTNNNVEVMAKHESSSTRNRQSPILERYTPQNDDKRRNTYITSNEERVGRQHNYIRNARAERTTVRAEIPLSNERQYLIYKLPATVELFRSNDNIRRVSYRRSSSEDRVLHEIQNARNVRNENLQHARRLLVRERSTQQLQEDIRSTDNSREVNQERFRHLSTGQRIVNEIQRVRNARDERNVYTRNNDDTKDSRQERSRSLIAGERLFREQRIRNEIRSNRQAGEEQVRNANRRTRTVREESATNEIVRARNVQERLPLLRITHLTRNTQHTTRSASGRSMVVTENNRRENTRTLPAEKRETNEVRDTRNERENRLTKTNEMKRNRYTRDVTIEIRLTRNSRDVIRAANEIRRNRDTRYEIQRNRNTREEREENELQRSRKLQEKRLSSTRRVLVSTEYRHEGTDAKNIRFNRYRSTSIGERATDERQVNRNTIRKEHIRTLSASLYREDKYSAGPLPVSSTDIESTLALKWQYLLYILQGIYLFSLLMKMPKENSVLKKNRAADWTVMMEYLKIH